MTPSLESRSLRSARTVWLGAVALLFIAPSCGCQPEQRPVPDASVALDGGDGGPGPSTDFDAGLNDPDAGPPPELKILKVLPPRGSIAGGAQVLVSGSGFIRGFATRGTEAKALTTLKFGSNPSLDIQIIDDETLEARLPPGNIGLTNVSIENGNGSYVCSGCFTYFEELYVTGLSPTEGGLRGGTEVTFTGAGFTDDVTVLFGGRASPKVTLVNSKELRAVTPPGAALDQVDVVAYNKNGLASKRRAFRYLTDLRVTNAAPLTGPLAGGTTVTLTGQGFTGATAVRFGGAEGTAVTVVSDTQLTVMSPPGTAGAVDLEVVTPRESWTVRDGFTYADSAGAFSLFGVYPHLGPSTGGDTVTLTGQGLSSVSITVSINGQPAVVTSRSATQLQVTVPARGGAPRRGDVTATLGGTTLTLPSAFAYRLQLSSSSPPEGPASGGTSVSVVGAHLPPDAQAFLGPLLGSGVQVSSETALTFLSPSGSGGAPSELRVREAADPENEAVLPAAFQYREALSIGRVAPARGAIAGGTLVTVYGSGFGDGVAVRFGNDRAKDVKLLDDHTLTCRTPRAEVGTVDVAVERANASDVLPGGFSFYDPRSIAGGLSGGPLAGTVNVTVLDATPGLAGSPVPLANVMLGSDTATPFQGLTDARGQITFSDPSLVKALTVNVWKPGFASATVTSVGAENLTVLVARTGGEGNPSSPPPGPPPSVITGRVTGFKPPRPLAAHELLQARVFVAQRSLLGGPPFQGLPNKRSEKWQLTTDGAEYMVFTNAGVWAVYAVLGVNDTQANTFTPFRMGVRRGVAVSPESPATNQDIVLDMHLDLTVPVSIDGPIEVPLPTTDGGVAPVPATNRLYAWLDLGAEGFVPHPLNWNTGTAVRSTVSGTQAALDFPRFPRLDGSNFIFLNDASSGVVSYPVSYFYRRQPGDLSAGVTVGPMLPTPYLIEPTAAGFTGTISWSTDPGPTPDIHQVQVLKPTLFGTVLLWSVVLPGTETQVVLPAPAVEKLRTEEAGNTLFVALLSSRSPKFNYNQWTYDTLSGVSWSSYTIALTDAFTP